MESWARYIRDHHDYLMLERALSSHTLEAYTRDVLHFVEYLEIKKIHCVPADVTETILLGFFEWLALDLCLGSRTEARMISGLKSFFRYLYSEGVISHNPTQGIETPKLPKKIPDVLSVEDIDVILATIDLSTNEGQRNKAIIETLYSCGIRVSELVNMKMSNLFFTEGFIKVEGKGKKERLVPISNQAMKDISLYIKHHRLLLEPDKTSEDIVFLNRNGKKLTRVMIFTIVKNLSEHAGLKKSVSPHTFRHSFATHLVEGGADLRSVQEMLGHESITTTEIYTHLDKQHLRDTILLYHPRALSN